MYLGVHYNSDGSSGNVDSLEKSLDEITKITKNNPRAFVSIETVSPEGTFCDTVQVPSNGGDMELI